MRSVRQLQSLVALVTPRSVPWSLLPAETGCLSHEGKSRDDTAVISVTRWGRRAKKPGNGSQDPRLQRAQVGVDGNGRRPFYRVADCSTIPQHGSHRASRPARLPRPPGRVQSDQRGRC